MRIVDSHFHWYPRSVLEMVCKQTAGYPRATPDGKGGYKVQSGDNATLAAGWAQW